MLRFGCVGNIVRAFEGFSCLKLFPDLRQSSLNSKECNKLAKAVQKNQSNGGSSIGFLLYCQSFNEEELCPLVKRDLRDLSKTTIRYQT